MIYDDLVAERGDPTFRWEVTEWDLLLDWCRRTVANTLTVILGFEVTL